jgi:hypothetical protein
VWQGSPSTATRMAKCPGATTPDPIAPAEQIRGVPRRRWDRRLKTKTKVPDAGMRLVCRLVTALGDAVAPAVIDTATSCSVAGDLIDPRVDHAGKSARASLCSGRFRGNAAPPLRRSNLTSARRTAGTASNTREKGDADGFLSLQSGTPRTTNGVQFPRSFPRAAGKSREGGCFDRRNLLGKTRILPP